MHLRFAVLLGGLALADLAYIDFALGPRVLPGAPVGVQPLASTSDTPEPIHPGSRIPEPPAGVATLAAKPEPAGPGSSVAAPASTALEPFTDGRWVIGHFETGRDVMAPGAEDALRRLASQLNGSHDIEIQIVGHSDARGRRDDNWALGARRAKAAADLLQQLGFAPERLSVRSSGEDKPAMQGDDEQSLAENRRVEIVVQARRSLKP